MHPRIQHHHEGACASLSQGVSWTVRSDCECVWQTAINVAEFVGLAIIVVVVVTRSTHGVNAFLRHDYIWVINIAVGAVCLLSLTTMACVLAQRVVKAKRRVPPSCD